METYNNRPLFPIVRRWLAVRPFKPGFARRYWVQMSTLGRAQAQRQVDFMSRGAERARGAA